MFVIKGDTYRIECNEQDIEHYYHKYNNCDRYGLCIYVLEKLYAHNLIESALKSLCEQDSVGTDFGSINLPSLFDKLEEGDEDFYFESGVEFVYDEAIHIVSNTEFISLVEQMISIHKHEPQSEKCAEYLPRLKELYK
ncbi:MAG: hypothetical protein K6F91_00110 [Ruminococcus sp.]|nr:hypothetical protein [Ruminococcus sp.]